MELGYFTMPLHPAGSELAKTLEDDLQQLIVLDTLGYSEAWLGEHFTAGWENNPAPDLLIAKASALTGSIRLGTGVSCLPNHDPFVLAHRIAVLDNLLGGRFMWGVGAGSFIGDFAAFDIDPRSGEQRTLTTESIEFILDLWDNPKPGVYGNGRWKFRVPEPEPDIGLGLHVKPLQKPHPPIAVAGISESSGTLALAGERGWIPMSINFVTPETLRTHWRSVAEGAARAHRVPERSAWRVARDIYVAETTAEARSEVMEGTLARDFTDYFFKLVPRIRGSLDLFKVDKSIPDSAVDPEYMMENMWIVGDPVEVAARIRELHRYLGGFGVLLVMGHEWEPREQWERSMRLMAEEVMPRLTDL